MAATRPLAEWPRLLCGPILRRVTPRSVAVFVATKEPCDVEVSVTNLTSPGQSPLTSPPQPTRCLGASLHVVVVQLSVPDERQLAPDNVYAYDVFITPRQPGGQRVGLAGQQGVLSGPLPLGYRANALPTFALPPGLQHLNLVHASCRKPHGGIKDALVAVDQMIAKAHDDDAFRNGIVDARLRPHQLLLTGDQIYADDVSLTLLKTLMTAGALLLGWSETFPVGSTTAENHAVAPGPRRESYLAANGKLTTDHKDGHLMFLAEFYAMYLMAWSDELWPRTTGPDGKPRYGVAPVDSLGAELSLPERLWLWLKAREPRDSVLQYAATVRHVRRVLANVPTFMMFDDHEVTDDWYLDYAWNFEARGNPTTRQIIRNALLAYAVFQDWGNEPSRYASGHGATLLNAVTVPETNPRVPQIQTNPALCDVVLDLLRSRAAPQERIEWDWMVDGPQHRVISLDTRTWRSYPPGPPGSGAALMSPLQLTRQLVDRRDTEQGRLAIIVSPAPVLGHPLLEESLQRLYVQDKGPYIADNEPWSANRPAFEDLLVRLVPFGRCVLLSGDVHYGFSCHAAYFAAGGAGRARVVQLCSSSAKNDDSKTYVLGGSGYLGLSVLGWLGFHDDLPEPAATAVRTLLDSPQDLDAARAWFSKLRLGIAVSDRLHAPAVIPAGPWMEPAYSSLHSLAASPRPTDWRYQVRYLRDERPVAVRLAEVPWYTAAPGMPIWVRTAWANENRAVVGGANVGLVRFRNVGTDQLEVEHRLHWRPVKNDSGGEPIQLDVFMVTEHVAPLATPTGEERPVVTPW